MSQNIPDADFVPIMQEVLQEVAAEYDLQMPALELPDRYVRFITEGEHHRYAELKGSFYGSPHGFKFTDDFLIDHFASSECYDSIAEHFDDDARKIFSLWPFTQLWGPVGKSSSIALFIDLSKPECPVLKWDEGQLSPCAESLDAFLASLSASP